MMDCLAAPKDATADENVKVVHTLDRCDRRRDLRRRHKFWGSTICQRFQRGVCR